MTNNENGNQKYYIYNCRGEQLFYPVGDENGYTDKGYAEIDLEYYQQMWQECEYRIVEKV